LKKMAKKTHSVTVHPDAPGKHMRQQCDKIRLRERFRGNSRKGFRDVLLQAIRAEFVSSAPARI
jgi:hypothetical protein